MADHCTQLKEKGEETHRKEEEFSRQVTGINRVGQY